MNVSFNTFYYKTGHFLQIYNFTNPVNFNIKHPYLAKHLDKQKYNNPSEKTPEQIKEQQLSSASRAKHKIRRLIYGNMYNYDELPKFVTLTFDPKRYSDLNDITVVNNHFKHFIQRLRYRTTKHISYIAIPERHESGNWHFHMLLFNMPYTHYLVFEKLIWKYGGTNMKVVKKTLGVTHYITKYVTKSFLDTSLRGKKRYHTALEYRPIRTLGTEGLDNLLSPLIVKTELPPRSVVIQSKTLSNGIEVEGNNGIVREFILNPNSYVTTR